MIDFVYRTCFVALFAAFMLAGCSRLDRIERRTFAPDSLFVASATNADAGPIKVHMPDGSIYVFSSWDISSEERLITGEAAHLNAIRDTLARGSMSVPIDSVSLVETNVRSASGAPVYFAALTAASAALTFYCAANPKACFGSCPTIYSTTADGDVLEAESFSHSIAPLFEMRDVDRIGAQPGPDGLLRLDVRNEALETHYINHLELLEVAHEPGAYAVPEGQGGAIVMNDFAESVSMTDRAGNDVALVLSRKDAAAYEADPATLAAADPDDAFDHIDIALVAPPSDSAAVLLTFRASLLSTVLFYDFMLAGQGLDAIGWLTRNLDTITGAVQIGEFYTRWMGVRIAVRDGEEYRDVGRLGGAGPIAWDDAAVIVPIVETDSLRIRISFLTDAFRIDRIAVARSVERRPVRTIPLARVESRGAFRRPTEAVSSNGAVDTELHADAAHPDERYLTTHPGMRFDAVFDAGSGNVPDAGSRAGSVFDHGRSAASEVRTYFLASQGYYIEWIRREWLQRDTTGMPAMASDEMLRRAFDRWRTVKSEYEDLFFRTKIPVR